MERIGLDAVAFLRFLRLMRWMFLLIGGLCCVVLIPLDLTWNKKNVSLDDRNFLSNLTIQNISGWPLYIHVTMSYVICTSCRPGLSRILLNGPFPRSDNCDGLRLVALARGKPMPCCPSAGSD